MESRFVPAGPIYLQIIVHYCDAFDTEGSIYNTHTRARSYLDQTSTHSLVIFFGFLKPCSTRACTKSGYHCELIQDLRYLFHNYQRVRFTLVFFGWLLFKPLPDSEKFSIIKKLPPRF